MNAPTRKMMFIALIAIVALTGCNQSVPIGTLAQTDKAEEIRKGIIGEGDGPEIKKEEPWDESGFATLRGRIVVDGSKPSDKDFPVTVDAAICGPNGKVAAGQIVMGADGGLANVLVYIEVKSKSSMPIAPSALQVPTEPKLLNQEKCIFEPHFVAVQVGETLRMKNSDTVKHDAAMKLAESVSYTIAPGGEDKHTFKKANKPAPMSCNFHPWMRGYIFIHKYGYFQLTDETGNFELKDVPCGSEISIRVWHERVRGKGGFFKKPNIVGAWKDRAKPTNTGFKIKLQVGEENKHEDLVLKVGEETIK